MEYKNAASTASLILVEGDAICLIKRKNEPFKGKWGFPGGFLNCGTETLEEAGCRELQEETNLITSIDDLELFCVSSEVDRDPRGHVVDHIYIVKKYDGYLLAGDDASDVRFFDLSDLPEMAFDHTFVLNKYKRSRC